MAYRACTIKSLKSIGFPDGLPQIVADYALSDYDKLMYMQLPIALTIRTGESTHETLYIEDQGIDGICIESSLTKGCCACMGYYYFIKFMDARHFDLDGMKAEITRYHPEKLSQFDDLLKMLIDFWWSI